MKIDIRKVIKNYEGEEMTTQDNEGKKQSLTVRRALNFVINGMEMVSGPTGSRPKVLTAEEKGRIYQLSTKLWSANKEVDFTESEISFIKERAGVVTDITPLLYGKVIDLLEGKNEEEKQIDEETGGVDTPEKS